MDSNLLKQFSDIINRRKARLNIRLAVFSFFLVVATLLWYLNKLSNDYTTILEFPIRIVNNPKGKVIVGEPANSLQLKVTAYGYNLLRYSLGSSMMPLTIDLLNAPVIPLRNSETRYYLLTSKIIHSFESQLSSELTLEEIQPDTIFFEFADLVAKRVNVVPDLRVSFERQYMQSGPLVVEPDTITISGPSSIIDTITNIKTLPLVYDKLYLPLEEMATLPKIQQVGFSHRKVMVKLPVEKYTEATIQVPIEIRNKPPDINIKLIPSTVDLKCNVVLSRYNLLKSSDFTLSVEYKSIEENKSGRLRVIVSRKPSYIHKIDFKPKYVDFIIEQK
ncbi:MAG TPA: hypothetical protein PL017_07890 [Tenuifilaceae bacterium]|nr:hypothetical protein [Tenuifilaceae bacterium]HPE18805.1 hypothetical protein [Tenuifilaceae bacterium]HPJ46004.1 hypothetical protein [Tenuifilaceae bacterium]HPQ34384.1 hypothetical protein [Tenuifilaceae bacterium]HRX68544.1 hypothetical protein [Tenuifilaceae bacterium]